MRILDAADKVRSDRADIDKLWEEYLMELDAEKTAKEKARISEEAHAQTELILSGIDPSDPRQVKRSQLDIDRERDKLLNINQPSMEQKRQVALLNQVSGNLGGILKGLLADLKGQQVEPTTPNTQEFGLTL